MLSNMLAKLLFRRRVVLAQSEFAELVLWRVPQPVKGSAHSYKYRRYGWSLHPFGGSKPVGIRCLLDGDAGEKVR